ncbi:unnamed protein product, partial [Rotaria sp. Silwood2]
SSGLGGAIWVRGVLCLGLNTGGVGNPGGVLGKMGNTSSSSSPSSSSSSGWVTISCCCLGRGATLGGFTKWAPNRGLFAAGSTGVSCLVFFSTTCSLLLFLLNNNIGLPSGALGCV